MDQISTPAKPSIVLTMDRWVLKLVAMVSVLEGMAGPIDLLHKLTFN